MAVRESAMVRGVKGETGLSAGILHLLVMPCKIGSYITETVEYEERNRQRRHIV